jgi:hypothetical protein
MLVDSAFASMDPVPHGAKKGVSKLQSPRDFVARFASAVTEPTPVGISCIAKNGDVSLFSTFQRMAPQVELPTAALSVDHSATVAFRLRTASDQLSLVLSPCTCIMWMVA